MFLVLRFDVKFIYIHVHIIALQLLQYLISISLNNDLLKFLGNFNKSIVQHLQSEKNKNDLNA